jgi:hypothetical protein
VHRLVTRNIGEYRTFPGCNQPPLSITLAIYQGCLTSALSCRGPKRLDGPSTAVKVLHVIQDLEAGLFGFLYLTRYVRFILLLLVLVVDGSRLFAPGEAGTWEDVAAAGRGQRHQIISPASGAIPPRGRSGVAPSQEDRRKDSTFFSAIRSA